MKDITEYLADARRGDRDAFRAIHVQTARELGWYCRRLTGNPQDAEDLMQETYLTAWQKLGQFGTGSFPAWLRTIARNTWLNRIRHEKPELSAGDIPEEIPENELLSPAHLAEQKLVGELIVQVMEEALSPEHRMTVLLFYYDEKTIPEIAAEMGCSVGTVKSRLHYARRKLRERLEERGIMLASGVPLLGRALQESARMAPVPAVPPMPAAAKAVSAAWKARLAIGAAAVLAAGGIGGAIAYRQGKQPVQETMQTEATMQTRLTIPPETQAETPAAPPAETEALMEPQPGGELVMQQFGQSVHTVYFTMGIPELFYTPREPSEIQQKVPELYWENGHVLSGRYPVRFEARDGTGDSIVVIGREGSYEVPLPADFLAQELDSVQLGALADTEYPVDTEHWEINPDLPPTFTAQRADFSGEKDGKACTGTVIYWETAMDERYPVVGSVYFFDFSGTRAEDYAAAEGSLLITELTVNKRDHVLPTVDVNKIPKEFLP